MVSATSSSSISSLSLLAKASAAAQKSAAAAATTSSSTTASSAAGSALSSLTGNFNQFLTLLTAQLQHQDPSNPMSTDNFTSEIAQFAGVQQQVQANTNLSTLISATQSSQMTSAIGLIGQTTSATTSTLPLQNSTASVSFNAPAAGPIAIAVSNSTGTVVKTATLNAAAGLNTWTWNGVTDDGTQMSDGQYSVAVQAASGSDSVALDTTVSGKVTGISKTASGIDVNMGASAIDIDDLTGFSGS
ncbi:flagellar hook assembly protein FlgD [Gluconobacter wancherniae]|nr:flagellar hook capping FlgD N-terminal domain-containing protein [Gluconobacter wancherniae]MBF0853999.1 flagellar biosynthesis protein FlgD [Gluconobacter wancherniae]GBD57055.1 Basal-body rod modification protein FlgD [Gluconobacter wancherniae NBRC 103581]